MDEHRLLEKIYAGATGSSPWHTCLHAVAQALGAARALMDAEVSGFQWRVVADEASALELHARGTACEMAAESDPMPTGTTSLVAPGRMMCETFRHDADTTLTLQLERASGTEPFGPADRERLRACGEHLARALAIHGRLTGLDRDRRNALAGLDACGLAIALVDARGEVRYANALAEAVFASRDGLVVHKSRLRCAEPGADRALAAALDAATRAEATMGAPASLRVERISSDLPYVLGVRPLLGDVFDLHREHADAALALVTIADTARAPALPADLLARVLDISPAQAAVVASLVGGNDVAAIAAKLDIKADTVRAHLKAVYRATGTTSQARLVSHVLRSLPILALDNAARSAANAT